MDKKTAEEMRKALNTVWNVCGKATKCNGCPALDENGVCGQYASAPYSWKVNKESRGRWKTKKTWREEFFDKKSA